MLGDESLEGGALVLLLEIERTPGPQGAKDSRVEEVDLRVCRQLGARSLREDRQPEAEQQFLENLDVGGDRLALDLTSRSDIRGRRWRC